MMKAAQVPHPGGDFQLVDLEIPEPVPGHVRVKVLSCGICHSDALVKDGRWPGLQFPRVPGHEVVGIVDKVGAGVVGWKPGQSVGVGWHGGHCFNCVPCREGDFINCKTAEATGVTGNGGFAEFMIARQEALVRIPEGQDSASLAPLLCAGVTAYNALRNSGARGGDLVAVQGIGGLGHLGLQYSRRLGFKTAAISRGKDKENLARELGADLFIDTETHNPAETLAGLGGARAILATAPCGKAISQLVDGLSNNGRLVVAAAAFQPMEISALQLIMGRRSVVGWPSGHARDTEETVQFSTQCEIYPMIETYPLEQVAQAYDRLIQNRARFRVVLRIPR